MPGRVSTRASAADRTTRKSIAPSHNSSRTSAVSRVSAVPAFEEGPETPLRREICRIFSDAQKTTASHRKLIVTLRKVQERCCYEPEKIGAGKALDAFNEEGFNNEVGRCVTRVLQVKKTEGVGDRIVRFLGQFLKHASEKDLSLIPQEELDETQVFPETPSSRLTSHILSILLPVLVAKEKTARFRATQIISHIINSLDSIEDEYYHLLRAGLLQRVKDREAMVRVQAVLGLGRLAGNEGDEAEDDDSDSDDSNGLLEKLLDVLQNDPSADVRRSLLLNLPLTPATLPYLLERARDLDAGTRRALYSRLLPALGDFRHLSLSMREKLLRWGLRDRDENVRKAAARLFRERWIEDCAGTQTSPSGERPAEAAQPSMDALLELLERIDIVNAGVDKGIAQEAMREFWDGRPDYLAAVEFDDTYWDTLSAEKAFLARSLNDFCRQKEDSRLESMVEEKMPEVTKLAFFIQKYANALIKQLQQISGLKASDGIDGSEEEGLVELEFVVEQLLHVAKTVDYSDEIGRRKMFSLLRELIALPELPEEVTRLAIEVLRLICGTDSAAEREFCGVVLEAVADVHDTIAPDVRSMMDVDEDESFHSAKSEVMDGVDARDKNATPTKSGGGGGFSSEAAAARAAGKQLLAESATSSSSSASAAQQQEQDDEAAKAIKEIIVNLKCLHIAQCMLQNVEENLKENVDLVTMLNNLVVPAVRSHEAPIRERGLLCLGLCCLLDKTLAEENLTLFLHCFTKGHPALQTTALQILCDILMTHPSILTSNNTSPDTNTPEASALQKQIFKVFSKGVKAAHEPEVQSAAVTSLCKLMLMRVVTDADLLKQLVTTFFEPGDTRDNAAARQALSYFLPMFAHSRAENMALMAGVVPAVVHAVVGMGEELEEDEEMVGMSVLAGMLVDWTDPRKLVVLDAATSSWDEAGKKLEITKAISADVHLDLAAGLLEKALGHGCPKEEKKVLLTMLGKLYVSSTSSPEKLENASQLAAEALDAKVAADAPSRNALTKFHTAVTKAIAGDKVPGSPRKSMALRPKPIEEEESLLEPVGEEDDKADVTVMPNENELIDGVGKMEIGVKEERMDEEGEESQLGGGEDSVLDKLLEDDDDETI